MMSNRGFSSQGGAFSVFAVQGCLPALFALAVGFCGCSSNNLKLAQMLWRTRTKSVAMRSSPYAPVPISQPSSPPPPQNTIQYGDSVDSVVASVDGNPITNFDVHNPDAGRINSLTGNNPANGTDPNSTLKQLIAQQLLDEESQKYADRVDEADVDRFIQQIEQRNHLTDAQLRTQLQADGTSYEAFRKNA